MADVPRTLDVPEKQVLIVFLEDEGQYFWHHRLLLIPTTESVKWVLATPDYEVQTSDLSEHRIVPLQRNAEFPENQRGFIYAFDPEDCSEARVEVMRRP